MPLAIPVIAGAIAGAAVVAADVAILGLTVMGTAVLAGAVAGAVVGGIQASINGGNLLEGVLFGAVGGAVGGYLGGYGAGLFSPESSAYAAENGALTQAGAQTASTKEMVALGGGNPNTVVSAGAGSGAAEQVAITGAMTALSEGLKGDQELPYGQTKEGFEAELAARQKIAETQAGAAGGGSSGAAEAAAITAAQRQREAELNAALTREKMKQDSSEFEKTLAQRKAELERPIEEANAARARQRETALGLTLIRKQKVAEELAKQSQEQYQEDLLA